MSEKVQGEDGRLDDLVRRLKGDEYTCPENMGCGMMRFCACDAMEDAADAITALRGRAAEVEALEAQLAQARECIQSLTNVCGMLSQRLDAFVRATCDITDCAGDVCAMSFADVIVSNARAALAAIDAQTPAISPPEAR